MGNYLNSGNEGFKQMLRSPIYVDKTGLIKHTNMALGTEGKCIALSHARRFGKSQAASMLDAYYSCGYDSRELFENFAIAKEPGWDRYLNKFNVIHLEMATMAGTYSSDLVVRIKDKLCGSLQKDYPLVDYSLDIAEVLNQIYTVSDRQFVVIIDEWDCIIRNYAHDDKLVHTYMQFLHDIFKSKESEGFLALGYITGIMPIKKIKDESALNNFSEYTMLESDELTKYFGFTPQEVQELCCRYGMDFDSVKNWYNGYTISGEHMYNPNSVYSAMLRKKLKSYWKNTASFESINTYIARNLGGLKEAVMSMVSGSRVPVRVSGFKNDLSIIENKDNALTALIHLGYLAYDADLKQAFIPNYEVATAFEDALVDGSWREIGKSLELCDELLTATWLKDADRVAEIVEIAHESYTSILKYNDENALSCVITMAYFTAQEYYNIERELASGKGFADIVMVPRRDSANKPAIVIELKWDKSADTAIRQIKEKRYAGRLSGYADRILLVGIGYYKDTKKHECRIEEYCPN